MVKVARMQRKNLRSAARKSIRSFTGLCLILLASAALAAPAGSLTHLSGTVSAKRMDGGTRLLSVGSEIQEGDELTTQRDTYARIKFSDGGEVVMRPDTALKVSNYAYSEDKPQSDNVVLNLVRGGLRAVTGFTRQTQSRSLPAGDRHGDHRYPRHTFWRPALR